MKFSFARWAVQNFVDFSKLTLEISPHIFV